MDNCFWAIATQMVSLRIIALGQINYIKNLKILLKENLVTEIFKSNVVLLISEIKEL